MARVCEEITVHRDHFAVVFVGPAGIVAQVFHRYGNVGVVRCREWLAVVQCFETLQVWEWLDLRVIDWLCWYCDKHIFGVEWGTLTARYTASRSIKSASLLIKRPRSEASMRRHGDPNLCVIESKIYSLNIAHSNPPESVILTQMLCGRQPQQYPHPLCLPLGSRQWPHQWPGSPLENVCLFCSCTIHCWWTTEKKTNKDIKIWTACSNQLDYLLHTKHSTIRMQIKQTNNNWIEYFAFTQLAFHEKIYF